MRLSIFTFLQFFQQFAIQHRFWEIDLLQNVRLTVSSSLAHLWNLFFPYIRIVCVTLIFQTFLRRAGELKNRVFRSTIELSIFKFFWGLRPQTPHQGAGPSFLGWKKIIPPSKICTGRPCLCIEEKRNVPPPFSKNREEFPPPFRSWKREIFYENACFSCPKSSKNAYFSKNRALRAHIIEKLQFLGPFRPSKRPIFDPFGRWGKFPRDPQFSPKSFPPFEISRNAVHCIIQLGLACCEAIGKEERNERCFV